MDPRLAKALLLEAALKCQNVLKNPLPVVRITDASTIPYTYMVWVHFRNYPAMFAGREELFREVHYALKSAGIPGGTRDQRMALQAGDDFPGGATEHLACP